MGNAELKMIPSGDAVKQTSTVAALLERYPDALVTLALRETLADLRGRLRERGVEGLTVTGDKVDPAWVARQVEDKLSEMLRPSLRPVVNATGVVVHTNLGRSPLGRKAWQAMEAVALSYSNLEYDLTQGGRGERHGHVERVLGLLTGAEAAVVVNNNAAAVLLVLAALARGKEVVVSRGELIEIGGSFRLPEVMAQGGALLREVGTTNRTHLSDYEAAIGENAALLMKAHRSNFRVSGFAAEVSREDLVKLARAKGVPVFEDLGSGEAEEIGAVVSAGVDLVSFSGDKMLGGPQAGIVVGRRGLVDKLKRHPLMRALRPDKLTIAGVEATCRLWVEGKGGSEIPVQVMLGAGAETLRRRAERLAEKLAAIPGCRAEAVPSKGKIGGGAAPEVELDSYSAALTHESLSETRVEETLRGLEPPVIARVEGSRVLLDVFCMTDGECDRAASLLASKLLA